MKKPFLHIFKRIGVLLIYILSTVGFVLLLSASSSYHKNKVCTSVHIDIDYDKGISFIDKKEILSQIIEQRGRNIIGLSETQLKLGDIEEQLNNHAYVEQAELFLDLNGRLDIGITQKQPFCRIIDKQLEGYYIDKKGDKIPLTFKCTVRLPVIRGHVDKYLINGPQKAIWIQFLQYIRKEDFFNALIDQIYIDTQGHVFIYPKLGDVVLKIGDMDNWLDKLERIKIFYKEALKTHNINKYNQIDLSFDSQIICSKK